MTTNQAPTKPEPLSIYVLHSPEERRRHAIEVAAYNDYLREEEQRQRMIEQAKIAETSRVLTDDEYFQLALKRKAEQEARDAAREVERQAAADAREAYLASLPEVAEISESNPYCFVQQIMHWTLKGYTLDEHAEVDILFGLHRVTLNKPEQAKKAK